MPQLGLGLGAQINESNSFDPDALRYFATAGVTNATGRSQINTFVRGIKSLGLYNNMVAWPLRSTQNNSSGTTAYSLGGLGVYNGTLTNSPTWGTGGITFNGTTQYIEVSPTPSLPAFSAFSITTSNSGATQIEFSKDDTATNRELAVYRNAGIAVLLSKGNDGTVLLNGPAVSANVITSMCGRHGTSFRRLRKNNESDFSGAASTHTQTATVVRIGCYSSIVPIYFFSGVIHASILFNTALSDTQTSAVYALYQTSLGAGLGLPDADASAYIARAGVTDTTGQQQINDFVVGVKNLGLYNNMVAWPLRSTQNKGAGTTAYSIGGLGTFDGTLTNGPTWGTGGITFDGTNDYINTTFTGSLSEFTAFSIATPTSSTATQNEFSKDAGVGTREFAIRTNTNGQTTHQAYVFNPIISFVLGSAYQTTIRSLCFRASSSVNKLRTNNGTDFTGTTGTLNLGSAAVIIGALPINGVYFNGVTSAAILFNKALTDSETSSMYTLYSTTLGSGLGLP
jgi:hypothetical protein